MSKSIFDLEEFEIYKSTWEARQKELRYRASYYDGSVYKKASLWGLGPRVAKEIRPLFLPLSRSVDIDAGIIPGGWTFPTDDARYDAWTAGQDMLFDMSAWDVNGVLFVHYGAMYGVSGLRIADLQDAKRVILQPANPTRFLLVSNSQYSTAPDLGLWVEMRTDAGGSFEYAEAITPELIRTFRDGVQFGFDGRDPEYPNAQGRVPIVECTHINDGTDLGECTYQKSIPMLNEVNEMASRLSEIIRKNADPQMVTTGAEPTDLQRGSEYMWFLPQGADAKSLTPTIDIDGVLSFIREIKDGVKESLPELSFDDVRKNGQVATATLEIQLTELVLKIKRTRPNYDRCLTTAMQMAGEVAAAMGLSEVAALNDHELILDPNRVILPMSPGDKIALEMSQIELDQMRKSAGTQEGA